MFRILIIDNAHSAICGSCSNAAYTPISADVRVATGREITRLFILPTAQGSRGTNH